MQAIRCVVWSTLVLNVTCWVLHSQFHTPFQYISTILLCCPGENHDSLNYSLHFLVSEGGRITQTLYCHHDQKNGVSTVTSKSFTRFWLLVPWSKMTDFTHNPMSNRRVNHSLRRVRNTWLTQLFYQENPNRLFPIRSQTCRHKDKCLFADFLATTTIHIHESINPVLRHIVM